MSYSNDPQPNPYLSIPSPVPNIDFPTPYWINKLKQLIIVGCLNPDLAYAELLVPAAAKMMWSVETPSTKQLIHEATGQSWICGAKQVANGAHEGTQIASSQSGRFLYGLFAGLDIAAYYAFHVAVGGNGVIDYASFMQQFNRRCSGTPSKFFGTTVVGGWPVPSASWGTGPQYLGQGGVRIGPGLRIKKGQVGAMVASCSFSSLFGTGGVIVDMMIGTDPGQVMLDFDSVNNLFSTQPQAIVQYFTTEGVASEDYDIALFVKCTQATSDRMVPVNGVCYARAWTPGAGDDPSYYNMIANHQTFT